MTLAFSTKNSLFWYTTKSAIVHEYTKTIDFRGCYGSECVYVARTPLPNCTSKIIGLYRRTQKLWAVSEYNTEEIEWVFAQERPADRLKTKWVSPVADSHVIPAVFDATHISADPDPHVAAFLENIQITRIRNMIEALANYNSRNSFSPDTLQAATFLQTFMRQKGCQNVQLLNFRAGYAPNIVCEIPGSNAQAAAIVVGAHYDSRSTNVNSPTQRAPGADDNGSGSAAILDILETAAHLIANEGFSFTNKIIFALFAGEEQGLVGSSVLAQSYVDNGVSIKAMVNLDMIGYPEPGAEDTIFWMSRSTTPSLTQLAMELARTYFGEDVPLATTTGCCSDQQSFYSRGFPAASVFESNSAGNNPNYHQSSDLPPTITYEHVLRNTKSAAALITTLAEITGPLKK